MKTMACTFHINPNSFEKNQKLQFWQWKYVRGSMWKTIIGIFEIFQKFLKYFEIFEIFFERTIIFGYAFYALMKQLSEQNALK